jgi:sterol desaturase/sphingolipid hydroxylase (fatty acid hydroxylase superfamily)
MLDEQIHGAIQSFGNALSQDLPSGLKSLAAPATRVAEYVAGPLIDHPGRFPWWGMVAALIVAGYAFRRDSPRTGPGGLLRYCFPREIWRNPSTWVDLKVGFWNFVLFGGGALNLTWRFSGALVASGITIGLTSLFGPREAVGAWNPIAIFLFAMAFSMASDFGYFLFHWAAHVFPPLWAIHKLHHSAEVMTPLTAARVHPLEKPVMGLTMALTTGILMGPLLYLYAGGTGVLPALGLDVFGSLFFILGHHLHHSHVWVYFGPVVGRIIVSPAQHQIHHSSLPQHRDRNFAEHWAFWDTLFGTLYLPKGREELKLGLTGYTTQPHTGLLKSWFVPVADSVRAAIALAARWRTWGAQRPGAMLPASSMPTEQSR